MGANVIFFIISVVVVCFPCYPMSTYFEAYWYPGYVNTHPGDKWQCLDEGKAVYYISLGGVILDFITTILPFTLFLKLRMPKRQKVAMCLTFFGGFIVCGAGVARTWTVHLVYFETYDMPCKSSQVQIPSFPLTYTPTNPLHSGNNYWFWLATGIEVCTALICASAPSLKFYFRRYLDIPDTRHPAPSTTSSTSAPSSTFNDTSSADSKRRLLFGSTRRQSSSWCSTEKSSFSASLHASHTRDTIRSLTPVPKSPMEAEAEAGYFSVLSEKNGHGAAPHYVPPAHAGAFHAAAALDTEELVQLEGDIVGGWYGRRVSAQEEELRAMGILAQHGKCGDVDVAKAVGEHPVFYPWQEKEARVEEW